MLQSILLAIVLFTMFALVSWRDSKTSSSGLDESDLAHTDGEPELDIKSLSATHYLLEAGRNGWRLNDAYYSNPKALLVYALGFMYNNPVNAYSKEELASLDVRIRLSYLLYTYSDESQTMETKIRQLTDKFLKRIRKIPKELQEEYALSNNTEDGSSVDLLKTITLVVSTQ